MIDNNKARKEVKLLKATNDVSYSELAEMADISSSGIYCWLNGQYDLGPKKLAIVEELIANLKGE